jgi:alpha-ketoglutarate-dependent taurine dioxygenase
MSFQAHDLTERIGTEIRATPAALLEPGVADEVRALLVQRGVLVFKDLNISDEDQVDFARALGSLRDEGEKGIFKISYDKKVNDRPITSRAPSSGTWTGRTTMCPCSPRC